MGKALLNKQSAYVQLLIGTVLKEKHTWTKQIQIAQLGEVDLTAEFVNGVDLSACLPVKVTMNANAGGNGGPGKPGRISGAVLAGTQKQPGAKVTLEGKNLKEALSTKADANGNFTFEDVPPGTYKLTAHEVFGPAKGSASVTVEANKPATQEISISR